MVNCAKSKIISVGKTVNMDFIFATTNSVVDFMRENRKKFVLYEHSFLPIFNFLKIYLKPSVTVLLEQSVNIKVELNSLLESTRKKYYVEPVIIKDLKIITMDRYNANLKIVMKFLKIDDVSYFKENPKNV